MLASAPVLYPQLLSFYFFVVIICSGGSEFWCSEGKFCFPLFWYKGKFWVPSKEIVFQEEDRVFNTGSGSRASSSFPLFSLFSPTP